MYIHQYSNSVRIMALKGSCLSVTMTYANIVDYF
jgi:hypothetical protein